MIREYSGGDGEIVQDDYGGTIERTQTPQPPGLTSTQFRICLLKFGGIFEKRKQVLFVCTRGHDSLAS